MASIQRKFAACLITLFVISPTGYTGPATMRTPDGCNEECDLAKSIEDCLKSQNVDFKKVSVTKVDEETSAPKFDIEIVLNPNKKTYTGCTVVDHLVECVQDAVDYKDGHYLTISIAPSTQGGQAYLAYKGHTGTGTIPDAICIDVSANNRFLSINTCKLESKVSEDAKQRGVKVDNLNVKVKKCEDNKLCLQVSGKVRESKLSESRVRGIVTALVRKHTGAPRINTDKLEVRPRSDKDSRTK